MGTCGRLQGEGLPYAPEHSANKREQSSKKAKNISVCKNVHVSVGLHREKDGFPFALKPDVEAIEAIGNLRGDQRSLTVPRHELQHGV